MITRSKLERLARIESDEGVVSVFIRLEPRLRYERGLATTKFRSALTRFQRRETSDAWKAAAERERERIEDFLADWSPSGRGVALFACDPVDIWEPMTLDVPVPTWLGVDEHPRTTPLNVVLDEYPSLALCVVQRDRATIYVTEQREAERAKDVESEVPTGHGRGGWSQLRWHRHTELHVQKHLKEVASALQEIHASSPFEQLVLGGTDEVTAALKGLLPQNLRPLLIGTVPVDVKHESEQEILDRARELSVRAERAAEKTLVERIDDRSRSGQPGVFGIEDTLRAVVASRVETLVVGDDFEQPGLECNGCGHFTVSATEACPVCSGELAEVHDVIDSAVERAFLDGSDVNFVFDGPAKEALSTRGGIGALLRF